MDARKEKESPLERGSPPRTVIVTGAGKGLGAAFARALAQDGARVVVNNRVRAGEPSSADAVVQSIVEAGGEAVAEYSDVAAPEAGRALVSRALEAFGGLDALVLNAGIEGAPATFEKQAPRSFAEVMEVNFHANVRIVEAALPILKTSPEPRVLFISSAAGLYGARGLSPYAASKGAVTAFALTLADEFARWGVNVNVLCPFAETPMTRRSGGGGSGDPVLAPERVAPVAVWLAGRTCNVSGQIWVACGGRVRRARLLEGEGGGAPAGADLSPAFLAEHHGSLGALEGVREFSSAQDCFLDIYAAAGKSRQ